MFLGMEMGTISSPLITRREVLIPNAVHQIEIPWCMHIYLHVFMLIRNTNGRHRQFEQLF